jgi:hypothetical protein
MSSFKIYLNDGTLTDLSNYQEKEGLNKDQIGQHFGLNEYVFTENMKHYETVYWCEPIIKLLDAYRVEKGAPVNLTSVFRSKGRQQDLIDRGITDAEISPHNMSFAADADCGNDTEVINGVKIIKRLSKQLNIPVRLGYQSYLNRGDTFIHIDVCNFYYGKKGPWADHQHS